jgi:hypothetical protein
MILWERTEQTNIGSVTAKHTFIAAGYTYQQDIVTIIMHYLFVYISCISLSDRQNMLLP